MFYRLHRLVKILVGLFILGVFAWLWQHRAAVEPVLVWYQVYENGGLENDETLPLIEGRALYIVDGHTLRLKTHEGHSFLVRLAGLDYPERPLSAYEMAREKQRTQALREQVLSNWVHVEVTYSQEHSVLGIAHVREKNLNLHFITNGLATLNRDYIKRMPREHQYDFFLAARHYQKNREAAQVAAAAK